MTNNINNILEDIETHGWSVQQNFFAEDLIEQLNNTLLSIQQRDLLQHAGIGRGNNYNLKNSIRSDLINWFDETDLNNAQKMYLKILDELQLSLNRHFCFGLFELEIHFALYAPGTFYKRHLDQHKYQDSRVLTIVTYLNKAWNQDDGGELCLYLNNGKSVSILPHGGTLVCFLSADFEHEVLPAKCDRASLTGWFRKRELKT